MAEWQTAGKVRMTPKGTWSGLVPYEILDCVLSPDNLKYYVAKQPVPANTALTNTDYWDVMSNVQDIADTVNDAADELDNNMSSLVIAQDEEPEEAFNKVWFDTSSNEEYTLPEINDNTVSATDTWSSQKIRNEIDAVGIPGAVKSALLACFEKVVWIDGNGQDYYDALEAALNGSV